MWMGFDSKYKTDRPPCIDFKTTEKLAVYIKYIIYNIGCQGNRTES
jgi:hypothetical protein